MYFFLSMYLLLLRQLLENTKISQVWWNLYIQCIWNSLWGITKLYMDYLAIRSTVRVVSHSAPTLTISSAGLQTLLKHLSPRTTLCHDFWFLSALYGCLLLKAVRQGWAPYTQTCRGCPYTAGHDRFIHSPTHLSTPVWILLSGGRDESFENP